MLLTHDHWEHPGGLPDLPNARVVMGKAANIVASHDQRTWTDVSIRRAK